MKWTLSLSAAVLALTSLVGASNVIDLDPDNFDEYVGGSRGALVEFFAPWCGHCKSLAPVYEQLGDAFPSDKVVIAKTDADGVGRALGTKFGVTGFPTLKWFPPGSSEPVDYTSGRDLDALAAFVTKESGIKSKIKPPPPPSALQLDSDSFSKIALDESKNVLVAFTAPWCGYCKQMKPAFEKVAKAFKSESNCVVAQLENSDQPENRILGEEYGVSSFPTIVFFPAGKGKEHVKYTGARTEEDFADFLNEQCGTNRLATGSLSDMAGKVLPLDKLASQFFTSTLPERPKILGQAKLYLSNLTTSATGTATDAEKNLKDSANYYIKAMERMISKGESWLVKEQARLAGLLGSTKLAPTKLDELKIKANILSSFVAAKAEEVLEDVEELWEGAEQVVMDGAEGVKNAGKKVVEKAGEATERIKAEL